MAVFLVIAAGTILRMVLAVVLGLGVDESYEVAVARHLGWSYFDHPPLVFWILHAVTGVFGEGRLAVRLPFILLFAGTTWLVSRIGARLGGQRAGIIAAVVLTISPVFSLSTGGWALPDGPLMFCTAACALALLRAMDEPARPWRWWLLAGLAAGGAMLSKYHGIVLVGAVGLFALTQPEARRRLAGPAPWAAALVAAALSLPVVLWNRAHDWISFRFQAGRGVPQHGLHFGALLETLGGQAGYVLPWIWLPLLWVFARAVRRGPRDAHAWLLCCLAAGPVLGFTAISLGGNAGLPHWEAPGYLLLVPLLGAAAAARLERGDRLPRQWLTWSMAVFAALVLLLGTQAASGWMPLRGGDPTLEMMDWNGLGPVAARLGVPDSGRFVVAGNWIQAGKAAYAIGPRAKVACLCDQPHHFGITTDLDALRGRDALIVEAGRRDTARFARWFATVTPAGDVQVLRGGRPALTIALSVGRGFRGR